MRITRESPLYYRHDHETILFKFFNKLASSVIAHMTDLPLKSTHSSLWRRNKEVLTSHLPKISQCSDIIRDMFKYFAAHHQVTLFVQRLLGDVRDPKAAIGHSLNC